MFLEAMALYNSKPILMILIPLLMLHYNSRSSFEFHNFLGAYTNKIFIFQGDAFASNGVIHLTNIVNGTSMPKSAGRVSHVLPVRLWDAKTGALASFTTIFSFNVTTNGKGIIGDGISFFIAPAHSNIPQDSSGGYLGLVSRHLALNTSHNHIVAVEFDTFPNDWDPNFAHIGIDINSIASVKTVPWINENNFNKLTTVFATVTYEPVAHNLSVNVSYPGSYVNGSTVSISLSHVVDLRTVLPEWVSVGFSGATGGFVEEHTILSWSFSSGFYYDSKVL